MPPDARLQVVAGDVTDKASLTAALTGAQGVVFAASGKGYWTADPVDHKGVANVAEVAQQCGVQRVVMVSSMLVTPKNWLQPMRLLLNNIRWGLMDAKFKGENALRSSGISYTVVRPGGLTKGPGGEGQLCSAQGDSGGLGSISRADVAAVCVSALTDSNADRVTVEIYSKPGAHTAGKWEDQLTNIWKGAAKDTKA
ncbi:MAG: hypothetical protein WDW36_003708 [Sanguina aurantia]